MNASYITKMDSKGRVLIPGHIREHLKIDRNSELVLVPDKEGSHIRLLPLVKGKTTKLRFLLADRPGSLASVANFLSSNNFNIIMSESRTLQKDKLAEWDVLIDTSQAKETIETLKDKLMEINAIKNVLVLK